MSSAFAIASSGLQAAQLRLDSSAHNVANMNTPGFRRQAVEQQAAPDQGGVQAQTTRMPAPGVALEQDVVEQMAASYAFKANVLVLRTAKDEAASLIVIGSHRPSMRDLLIGPNAAHVVRQAACSVFVVRPDSA